ncbi:MAG: hypothetical protein QM527_09850 [Alphaproteobacteria bacterium]|nr:hypothetical protein [Alphaproteobacteria bacterium]
MHIHQLSVHYDGIEDRLLLRVNTTDDTEVCLWLTRRLTLALIPQLPKIVANQLAWSAPFETPLQSEGDKTLFAEFKQQEFMSQFDFSTPYKTPAKNLIQNSPLVVTDIRLSPQKDGYTLMVFLEKRGDQTPARTLEMRLAPQLTQGFLHLITQSLQQSGWNQVTALPMTQNQTGLNEAPKGLLN